MFVSCECCVLSDRGLCDGLITVQRSLTDCGASLCMIKKLRKRGGKSPLPGCENTITMVCTARKTTATTTTTVITNVSFPGNA